MRVRAGAAAVAVVLVVLLMPQGASAQEPPSITVTPSTGLVDGQTVTVTGTGWDPNAFRWAGTVCLTEVLTAPPAQINALCGLESVVEVTPNPTGGFSTSVVVHEVQQNFVGGSIDCGLAGCVISFIQVVGPTQVLTGSAAAPIRFGPATPTTKADCKDGGWRNLANDRGQPFRNQGGCVSHVVAHRR